MINVKDILSKNHISPSIEKDQYFLADEKIIDELIKAAEITKEDRVLEVGPGLGFLTRELAKVAKEVLAIEIDKTFKPFLNKLPKNVEIVYGNAYRLLNNKNFLIKTKPPTKVVSNIPYSQAQNMLHNYTNSGWYNSDLVWIAPLSSVNKINKEPILSAYFQAKLIKKINKDSFFPKPNTVSAIIRFKRVDDPKKTKNFDIYLRRFFYNHEEWKVKNMLREAIIHAARDLKGRKITKNEARKMIKQLRLPKEELEKPTNNIKPDYYFSIPKQIKKML